VLVTKESEDNIMKLRMLAMSVLAGLSIHHMNSDSIVVAQQNSPAIDNLYHVAMNGSEITVDGSFEDWSDAQWVYLSVDHPLQGYLDAADAEGKMPTSPSDGSAWFAMKMDGEHVYLGLRVRDDVPMLAGDATGAALYAYDHLSVFLGLYDLGSDAYSSPHLDRLNMTSGAHLIHPSTSEAMYTGSTYRISSASDNSDQTLGPDYHLGIRAVAHDGASISGDQVNQHNFGYVDAAIANTTASIQQWSDGEGYNLEWKVPFASLAGKIASPTGNYSDFEWPSFTPEEGLIFSFDVEVGDADEVADEMNTEYLRLGTSSNLANYSSRFGFRAKIVDMSNNPLNTPRWTYPIDYKTEQNVELDADLSDWNDAFFWGMNQDHPLFTEIQGIPQSPEDFSGYFAMKMDDQNLYVAVRVRDEGTPMIQTLDTPNLAFNYDHVSVYLGLYDISDIASNPHVEGPGEFYMFRERFAGTDTARTDTIISNRTYRIRPEIDNTSSTRGADYQMLLRALPYGPEPVEPEEYSGAYVDTTIYKGTEAAADYTLDEQGYIMEWKVPFESLAGEISKGQKPLPGNYRGIEWPLFSPENGVTISFDADLTDRDERDGARGMNRFLRMGDLPALWRDSKSFKMRGHIVETRAKVGVSIDEDLAQNIRPYDVYLSQNYPNPFNPSTQIEFYLPNAGELSLEVYNLLGQKVATVTNGFYSSGMHSVTFDASALSSGVYVYTLKSGQQMHSRKFTLIK
jgi:hypothetical protein